MRKLVKITKDLEPEALDFYNDNHDKNINKVENLSPKSVYFGVYENGKLSAVSAYKKEIDKLALIHSTLVKESERGKGLGKFINTGVEEELRKEGVKKIVSHVYTDNIPNIIMKLKLGYIVEGTLRDHEKPGSNEYILGKFLD